MPISCVSGHGADLSRGSIAPYGRPYPKPVRRLELITGGGRRRRWSTEEKAKIVAESFAPGAIVAEVARQHDARPQQVHGWRRDAREGRLVLPADETATELVSFSPVVVAPDRRPQTERPARSVRAARPAAPAVEMEASGIVVRIRQGADVEIVEAITRALRASS